MTGIIVLIRVVILLSVFLLFMYLTFPSLFNKKTSVGKEEKTSLDCLEEDSLDIVRKSEKIRGVTKQTQEQINNINKNLKK